MIFYLSRINISFIHSFCLPFHNYLSFLASMIANKCSGSLKFCNPIIQQKSPKKKLGKVICLKGNQFEQIALPIWQFHFFGKQDHSGSQHKAEAYFFTGWGHNFVGKNSAMLNITRQVYNLFQWPVEQVHYLGGWVERTKFLWCQHKHTRQGAPAA